MVQPLGKTLVIILFLIVGVIAVVVTINPSRKEAQERNERRARDVAAIAEALQKHGPIPNLLPGQTYKIKSGQGNADLCSLLVPKYLPHLPVDPIYSSQQDFCQHYDTGYELIIGTEAKVVAPYTDLLVEPSGTTPASAPL